MSAPICNPAQHAYRGNGGVFDKGILCLCGGRVLDRTIRSPSSWLMGTGWPTLLREDAYDTGLWFDPLDLPLSYAISPS